MMSNEQQGNTERPLRDVPIDWESLEDAFENNAPEVHSYLHLSTGEVLRVVDGIADPDTHSRIAVDEHYVGIEPVSSREQYRWMERFIPMVDDRGLRERLTQAIDGKGAFRRFKDALMSYSVDRERWFTFRSERLRVFMEAWLEVHSIRPVPRPAPAIPAQKDVAPISQEQLSGRRGKNMEVLRAQLKDVVEGLGLRDLDKLVTFAEFLRARRVSRGFNSRLGPGDEGAPEDLERDSAEEEAPISQEALSVR